jgi:RNA polymerase nonessential primary-like sigma factor
VTAAASATVRSPRITGDEQRALGHQWHAGQAPGADEVTHQRALHARERLVASIQGWVRKLAREYEGRGVAIDDLVQEGNLGLLRALDDWDPACYSLIGWATWKIRSAMWQAVQNQGRPIRIPGSMQAVLRAHDRVAAALQAALDRPPTDREVAQALGRPITQIAWFRAIRQTTASLDAPLPNDPEGDRTLADLVADPSADTAADVASAQVSAQVAALLARLPSLQEQVLIDRYALHGRKPSPTPVLAARLGIGEGRVRALELEGLARLRRLIGQPGAPAEIAHTRRDRGHRCAAGCGAVVSEAGRRCQRCFGADHRGPRSTPPPGVGSRDWGGPAA